MLPMSRFLLIRKGFILKMAFSSRDANSNHNVVLFGTNDVKILSEQRTFLQRLPNVVQTSMAFGQRWVDVVMTLRVHRLLGVPIPQDQCTFITEVE